MWVVYVLTIISHVYLVCWCTLRIIYVIQKKKACAQTSSVELYLTTFSVLTRIVEVSCPISINGFRQIFYIWLGNSIIPYLSSITACFSVITVISRLCALIFILGFWIDVIFSSLFPKLTARTKIATLSVGIILGILELLGLVLVFVVQNSTEIGAVLVIVPLLLTSIAVGVLALVVHFCAPEPVGAKSSYKEKKQYMVKIFLYGSHSMGLIYTFSCSFSCRRSLYYDILVLFLACF